MANLGAQAIAVLDETNNKFTQVTGDAWKNIFYRGTNDENEEVFVPAEMIQEVDGLG